MKDKTLEEIIKGVVALLKNKEGLYHGWFALTIDKYGYTYTAWACLNPPEFSDYDLERTRTPIFHRETPLDAMCELLDWLVEWDKNGRKYKKYSRAENEN